MRGLEDRVGPSSQGRFVATRRPEGAGAIPHPVRPCPVQDCRCLTPPSEGWLESQNAGLAPMFDGEARIDGEAGLSEGCARAHLQIWFDPSVRRPRGRRGQAQTAFHRVPRRPARGGPLCAVAGLDFAIRSFNFGQNGKEGAHRRTQRCLSEDFRRRRGSLFRPHCRAASALAQADERGRSKGAGHQEPPGPRSPSRARMSLPSARC